MEKVSKKELQTRREFFKQAAKGVLPILGLTILGPTLASCDKVFGGDCDDCSDSCSDSCVTGCKNGCSASCSSGCKGSCQTVCTTTCKGSCSRRFSK
jgi:CXXX repeat radical SAM target protein